MTQAKLLKFKTSPTNFLFREIFNFEANYMYTAELPNFPKEFKVDTSELKKGLKRISAFAISKYIIKDLTNLRPRNIFRNLISLPNQLLSTILQARTRFQKNNFINRIIEINILIPNIFYLNLMH